MAEAGPETKLYFDEDPDRPGYATQESLARAIDLTGLGELAAMHVTVTIEMNEKPVAVHGTIAEAVSRCPREHLNGCTVSDLTLQIFAIARLAITQGQRSAN